MTPISIGVPVAVLPVLAAEAELVAAELVDERQGGGQGDRGQTRTRTIAERSSHRCLAFSGRTRSRTSRCGPIVVSDGDVTVRNGT